MALKVLGPLGGEFLVSPCVPPAGWRGQTWDGKLTFSVAPFGEEAGTIDVHLRYSGCEWQPEDNRHPYLVPTRWYTDSYDETFAVCPDGYEATDSLAEAVALCHAHGHAYRAAVLKAKRDKEAAADRAIERKSRKPTPGEQLLEALELWHRSVSEE